MFCKFFPYFLGNIAQIFRSPVYFRENLAEDIAKTVVIGPTSYVLEGENLNIRHFASPLAFAPFTPYYNTSKVSSRHQHILSVLGCSTGVP